MEISGNSYIPSTYAIAEKKNLPSDVTVNAELMGEGKKVGAPYVQSAEDAKAAAKVKNDQAIADFNEYMSMSTMEKFTESWLRRHGMSKEEFEKLGAEEKKKIIAEIKEDFIRAAKEALLKKGATVSFFA